MPPHPVCGAARPTVPIRRSSVPGRRPIPAAAALLPPLSLPCHLRGIEGCRDESRWNRNPPSTGTAVPNRRVAHCIASPEDHRPPPGDPSSRPPPPPAPGSLALRAHRLRGGLRGRQHHRHPRGVPPCPRTRTVREGRGWSGLGGMPRLRGRTTRPVRHLSKDGRIPYPVPPPPQAEGYVIPSCIKHIPLAGRVCLSRSPSPPGAAECFCSRMGILLFPEKKP